MPPTPTDRRYSDALWSCLCSGHHEMRSLALRHLDDAFEATSGNAVHAAAYLGVAHRTLMRWCSLDAEVLALLHRACHAASVPRTCHQTGTLLA
jgi:hypothetical protein